VLPSFTYHLSIISRNQEKNLCFYGVEREFNIVYIVYYRIVLHCILFFLNIMCHRTVLIRTLYVVHLCDCHEFALKAS